MKIIMVIRLLISFGFSVALVLGAVAGAAAQTPSPAAKPVSVAKPVVMPPEKPAMTPLKQGQIPAKTLFSSEKLPSLGKAMAIGYYPRGCLQGGVALPVTGPTWQVMRISRNRMWGHPSLVKFLEKFAPLAAKATGWHGVLVGDMAQPRGGPLPFGHMSHQIGLDVDIWFMPMPGHVLSDADRDKISAINLVADDWKHVNPKTWQPQADVAFIRTAAEQPEVERVLVNAAIKKEICRMQGDRHPAWMDKLRPWYGHNDHIHVRLKCPADSPNCRKQPPVPDDAGCGKSLDYWFSDRVLHPKPRPKNPNAKPPRAITLADLPPACKTVLDEPPRLPGDD
jgi:penicillin-insensitive murein endopeptidase